MIYLRVVTTLLAVFVILVWLATRVKPLQKRIDDRYNKDRKEYKEYRAKVLELLDKINKDG